MPPPVAPRVRACRARCSGACHESPPADRRTPRHCAPQSSPATAPRSWQGSCPDPGRICSWLRSFRVLAWQLGLKRTPAHSPWHARPGTQIAPSFAPHYTRPLHRTEGGLLHPREIDWVIMGVYFVFVLGIGYTLRRHMKTSTDYFLSGRSIPAWSPGLPALPATRGAQEVIGMAASGAKYGMAPSHFYWVGAIPAMVFLGVFMMPFYYGSRARSVPEYLRLRFDEKTRGFNAISFTCMTIFSSGISMYAMAKLLQILHIFDAPFAALGLGSEYIFHVCIVSSAIVVLVYVLLGGLSSA